MMWIKIILEFLSKLFMPKAQAAAPVIKMEEKRMILPSEAPNAHGRSMSVASAVSKEEAMISVIQMAKDDSNIVVLEAEKSKKASLMAQIVNEKAQAALSIAQAEAAKRASELETEQARLKTAEIEMKIAEAQALVGKAKIQRDNAEKTKRNFMQSRAKIADITDEEVFSGVQFSPSGDAIVWTFKRIGTDIIFVGFKSFNQKEFNKRS